MNITPCKCGKIPNCWHFGDVYVCGCINPKCHGIYPVRSLKSKQDAVSRWNEKMKGETRCLIKNPYNELDRLVEKELIPYGITIENFEENKERVEIVAINPPTLRSDDAISIQRHDFYIDGAYAFSVEYRVVWGTISEGIYSTKIEVRIVKKGEKRNGETERP